MVGLCALAHAAEAQTLRGTVLDAETGSPVTLAYVGLLQEGRELVVAALADNQGGFALRAPAAGSYLLYVARTGYETLMEGVFDLGEDGELELRVGLKPSPVPLEEVVVATDRLRSPLEANGFYERAVSGRGDFLIREDIERLAVDKVTDAFREIPSVAVLRQRPLIGPDVMQSPEIVIRRAGGQCSPTLYVDRAVVQFGVNRPVRPDDYVAPSEVEAIEVYSRRSEVPVEFDAVGDCGVVVIWTRMR